MKLSSFGPRPGRAKPLDVIFVARRTLQAVPDPPCLRVGTEMHVLIVGRIVGNLLFGPVLRRVNVAARGGAALCTGVWRR